MPSEEDRYDSKIEGSIPTEGTEYREIFGIFVSSVKEAIALDVERK
jgi:hypothetical protein